MQAGRRAQRFASRLGRPARGNAQAPCATRYRAGGAAARRRRIVRGSAPAPTHLSAASGSMVRALQKEIGIDLARQHAADPQVGGVLQKRRGKIKFGDGELALVERGAFLVDLGERLAVIVLRIEPLFVGGQQPLDQRARALGAEPEQGAVAGVVIGLQHVAPLLDRQRQARLLGQQVEHVEAHDGRLARRQRDLRPRRRGRADEGHRGEKTQRVIASAEHRAGLPAATARSCRA